MSDPSTVVSAAPFVADLKPYIDVLVPPIVMGLIGWATLKIQQVTNVTINQAAVAKLQSAAATQAGKMIAAAEDGLAGKSITVNSPMVASAAAAVAAAVPEAMNLTGITPDAVKTIVAGEIGKLQAQQTAVAPAPVAK